jgi:hypothetical protein
MSRRLTVPAELQHLIEKREQKERREKECSVGQQKDSELNPENGVDNSAAAAKKPSGSELCSQAERRTRIRRKND